MAVTINARGTESHGTQTSPRDLSGDLTIAAGANIALTVTIVTSIKTPSISAVAWDQAGTPQAMGLIANSAISGASTGHAEIWGLLAPTTGAKNLRITWSGGSTDIYAYLVAWNGADQTAAATTFAGFTASGSSSSPSTVVTSTTGDGALDILWVNSATPSAPTQTSDFIDTALTNNVAGSDNNAAGSSPWTFGWTLSGSDTWIQAAAAIKAVGAIGGSTNPVRLISRRPAPFRPGNPWPPTMKDPPLH